MRAYFTLVRRELAVYFLTWTGYVIIAGAALLMGLAFIVLLRGLHLEASPVPVTQLFFGSYYFWLVLLLAPAVITMRLFASEQGSGTFETLMTTPVSDGQVVLAKYSAALLFFALMLLPLAGGLSCAWRFGGSGMRLDPGPVIGALTGVMLVGALFLSLGCLASAMTRSQVMAAMGALAGCVGLFVLGFFADRFATGDAIWEQMLYAAALREHLDDFARGIVDTRPVVFCVTFTFLFLFLALRALERRRWR